MQCDKELGKAYRLCNGSAITDTMFIRATVTDKRKVLGLISPLETDCSGNYQEKVVKESIRPLINGKAGVFSSFSNCSIESFSMTFALAPFLGGFYRIFGM